MPPLAQTVLIKGFGVRQMEQPESHTTHFLPTDLRASCYWHQPIRRERNLFQLLKQTAQASLPIPFNGQTWTLCINTYLCGDGSDTCGIWKIYRLYSCQQTHYF